jgi:hypothetical protein
MAGLKTLLIVLAIALLGVLALTELDSDASSLWVALNAAFERQVDACQEGHPNWARFDCERIVREEIWVGMTQEMILASLGEPSSIEPASSDDSTYEEWTYRSSRYGEEIMRFEDGLLTAWTAVPCDSCAVKPPRK